jgi:hypothetical protein
VRAEPTPPAARELRLTGEVRYYRHIDPVTGWGAVSLVADGKDIPLDLRQFTLDILVRPIRYEIKGHWSKEKRFVVVEVHPAAGETALLP